MKSYTVIALSVGGSSNRIFRSGDNVTDTDFPMGHAAQLVEQGFLQEVTGEPEAKPKRTKK